MSISDRRRTLPPLNAVRAFEAAARLGSFKEAAIELGVTHGAISQQVRLLEDRLGAPALFWRSTRRVKLTSAGTALLEEIGPALDRISAAVQRHRATRGEVPAAVLRVNALATFSMRWLLPRLRRFRDERPDIEVRLATSNDPIDALAETFDVVIRGGPDFVSRLHVAAVSFGAPVADLQPRTGREAAVGGHFRSRAAHVAERHVDAAAMARLVGASRTASRHPDGDADIRSFFPDHSGGDRWFGRGDGTYRPDRRRCRGRPPDRAVSRGQSSGEELLRLLARGERKRLTNSSVLRLAGTRRAAVRRRGQVTALATQADRRDRSVRRLFCHGCMTALRRPEDIIGMPLAPYNANSIAGSCCSRGCAASKTVAVRRAAVANGRRTPISDDLVLENPARR